MENMNADVNVLRVNRNVPAFSCSPTEEGNLLQSLKRITSS